MKDNTLLETAEQLKSLRERKEALETELDRIKAEIEDADRRLSDMMAESETPNFTHGGTTFYLTTRLRAGARAGMRQELFDALRKNGAGSLVTETVNSNTLSSYVRELKEGNNDAVPAWLEPYVSIFEKTTVGIRKNERRNGR